MIIFMHKADFSFCNSVVLVCWCLCCACEVKWLRKVKWLYLASNFWWLSRITFTPTVQHCSMATIIGLSLRLKLLRCLPPRFKVDIFLAPGSHSTEAAINKQLNDKERVAAAFENPNLVDLVEKCLVSTEE